MYTIINAKNSASPCTYIFPLFLLDDCGGAAAAGNGGLWLCRGGLLTKLCSHCSGGNTFFDFKKITWTILAYHFVLFEDNIERTPSTCSGHLLGVCPVLKYGTFVVAHFLDPLWGAAQLDFKSVVPGLLRVRGLTIVRVDWAGLNLSERVYKSPLFTTTCTVNLVAWVWIDRRPTSIYRLISWKMGSEINWHH